MEILMTLMTGLTVVGLIKQLLLALLALVNALLALLATVAVWRTYMVIGSKVLLTILLFVPILGIIVYVLWGQKKVREAAV